MVKLDPMLKDAIKLVEEKGWLKFNLIDLTHKKGVTLAKVHAKYPSRLCLLEEFAKAIDQQTLEQIENFDESESSHDKLFSVIMTRFDVLAPYKKFIKVLWQDAWKDPSLLLSALPTGLNSMSWLLQAASIEASGLKGVLRTKVLAAVYLTIVWAWLDDETETLDKTMVAVDKGLQRLVQVPGFYDNQ